MFKNGYAVFEEEEGEEEEEEEEEGAVKEATKSTTDWLLCKITDYNVQSGEHLVSDLRSTRYSSMLEMTIWMVLASQRTKPTKNEDQVRKRRTTSSSSGECRNRRKTERQQQHHQLDENVGRG